MDELKRGLALVRYHAEKCEEHAARCDGWKSPMMQQRAEALRADARALQAVERAVRDAQRLREALERLVDIYTNGYPESDYAARVVNEARAALAAVRALAAGDGQDSITHWRPAIPEGADRMIVAATDPEGA